MSNKHRLTSSSPIIFDLSFALFAVLRPFTCSVYLKEKILIEKKAFVSEFNYLRRREQQFSASHDGPVMKQLTKRPVGAKVISLKDSSRTASLSNSLKINKALWKPFYAQ